MARTDVARLRGDRTKFWALHEGVAQRIGPPAEHLALDTAIAQAFGITMPLQAPLWAWLPVRVRSLGPLRARVAGASEPGARWLLANGGGGIVRATPRCVVDPNGARRRPGIRVGAEARG